jgi:predicted negative regulator of RcsB-dependent stress response
MRSTIKLTLRHREEHQGEHQEEEHLDLEKLPNALAEKGYGAIRENIGKFQSPFSTGYASAPPFQQGRAPAEASSTPAEGQKPSEEKKKD